MAAKGKGTMKTSTIFILVIIILIMFRKRNVVALPSYVSRNDFERFKKETERLSVSSFALMKTLIQPNKPRLFLVQFDETLNGQANVKYDWNGKILFQFDIYALDPQPTFN